MDFITTTVWNAFKKKLEKRLASRAKIIGIEKETLSITLDSTWRDLDVTSQTSAKAKWAIISVYFSGTSAQSCGIQWRKKGRTPADTYTYYTEVGDGTKNMSWQFLIEMDNDQIFQYNGSSGGTVNVYLNGYIETGKQWA